MSICRHVPRFTNERGMTECVSCGVELGLAVSVAAREYALETGIQAGASLFDSGIDLSDEGFNFDQDYVRGMVETLARMFPITGWDTGTRAENIYDMIAERVRQGRTFDA